jgi:hypothetical protein
MICEECGQEDDGYCQFCYDDSDYEDEGLEDEV